MSVLAKRETWRRPKPIGPARYTPDLTPDEQENIRKALQVLRRRLEGWAATANVLGVKLKTLEGVGGPKGKPSVALALRAARAIKVPLEDILTGAWPKPGACPMCGRCDATR